MRTERVGGVCDPARLEALRRTALLDSPTDAGFDRLTRLAARILQVPIVLVSLVDAHRQFFKSSVGLPEPWASRRETPLSHSFCTHHLTSTEPLLIEDARTHPLVCESPAIPELGVVAYAGVPLVTSDGYVLGSFCAIDSRPRLWTQQEVDVLTDLAASVMTEIELRTVARNAEQQTMEAERERRGRQDLLDACVEGIYGLDVDGRCTYINRAAQELLGYTAEECLGQNMHALVHYQRADGTPYPVEDCPMIRSVARGRAVRLVEDVLWQKDGSPLPVLYSSSPVRESGRAVGAVVMILDNRQQKRAEATLVRYQLLTDQTRDIILVMDHAGHILDANRAASELYGYDRATLLSMSVRDLRAVETLPLIERQLAQADTGGILFETIHRRSDGTTFPVEVSSIATDVGGERLRLSVIRDISGRKQAEEQLREERYTLDLLNRTGTLLASELDLDRLVQQITDAATEVTGAEFGAFFYNVLDERGESYLLYTLSGVPREAFAQFPMPRNTAVFGPTFRGEGVVRLADVTQDPRYGRNPPYYGMPAGHLPVRSYLAVPVTARTGEVVGGLFFGHSTPGVFTERAERLVVGIAAQAAVAIDNARLYQAAQRAIRVRDEFLSIAAHELRTPVTIIKGSAQGLLRAQRRGQLDEDRLTRWLQAINDAGDRLARLTADLLDVSRIRMGRLQLRVEAFDLAAFLGEVAEEYRGYLDERHTLAVDVAASPCPVEADANRLRQVIENLLDNAVKYSPDGGPVDLRLLRDDEGVRVEVADEGIGLPANAEEIFEPFGRAANALEQQIPGMGLGLYVCRNIVEQHGGRLWVESQGEGQGSRFAFTLPYRAASAAESDAPQA